MSTEKKANKLSMGADGGVMWVRAHYHPQAGKPVELVATEEIIPVRTFDPGEEVGSVWYSIHRSFQPVAYESIKVAAGFSMPCREAELEECFNANSTRLHGLMESQFEQIKRAIADGSI